MTVRDAGEAIAGALKVRDGMLNERDRAYYDTFDGLLHGDRLSLVHEDGQLSLVERETGLVRASLPTERPARPLFAGKLAPGPLREALLELSEIRALLPLVTTHARERPMAVLDG